MLPPPVTVITKRTVATGELASPLGTDPPAVASGVAVSPELSPFDPAVFGSTASCLMPMTSAQPSAGSAQLPTVILKTNAAVVVRRTRREEVVSWPKAVD